MGVVQLIPTYKLTQDVLEAYLAQIWGSGQFTVHVSYGLRASKGTMRCAVTN